MTSHTSGLADVRPAWQLCQPSTPLAPRCASAALGLARDTQLVAMCVVRGPAEACSLVAVEWHRAEPRRTPDVCTSPSTKKLQSLHSVPWHVHVFFTNVKALCLSKSLGKTSSQRSTPSTEAAGPGGPLALPDPDEVLGHLD